MEQNSVIERQQKEVQLATVLQALSAGSTLFGTLLAWLRWVLASHEQAMHVFTEQVAPFNCST